MSTYTPYTARPDAPTPHNMVARSSTNRFTEHRSTLERQAVFSFKLKISNPVRVDIWFREFDDIVFDLRLTGLMTESQPTLDVIQSHFSELGESEQQQLLQNALAHWYDEEARLYKVLRDGIDIAGAFEIIYTMLRYANYVAQIISVSASNCCGGFRAKRATLTSVHSPR